MENNDGTWPRGLDGPNWDPNKRYGEPMRLSDIIKKLNGMEGFLMHEAYMALIHDNVSMSYTNENSQTENAFNCRFESTELNTDEESNIYVVEWDYKCQYLGNVS